LGNNPASLDRGIGSAIYGGISVSSARYPRIRFSYRFLFLLSSSWVFTVPSQSAWDVFTIPQQGGTEEIVDLNFVNENEGWFLVGNAFDYEIHHTTNAAEEIVLESTGETDLNDGFVGAKSKVHFRSASLGYFLPNGGFSEDVLLKTVDGGKTFEPIETPFDQEKAIHLLAGDKIWLAGIRGATDSVVAVSENGGMDWTTRPTPLVGTFYPIDIYFFNDEHGWVTGESGQMMFTHDGGQTWEIARTGTTNEIKTVRFVDPDHGWGIGSGGLILVTKDGGRNWIRQESGTTMNLYDLEVLSENEVYAVGGQFPNPFLGFTEDGGANWVQENLPVRTPLGCIQSVGNRLYVGGAGLNIKGDMYLFRRGVSGHTSPVIVKRNFPPGVVGNEYEAPPLRAKFGTAPYTWTMAPAGVVGLSMDPSTGRLQGTPTLPGLRTFNVSVTDVNGETDEASFSVSVASQPFSAGTDPLPQAVHRKTYRAGIDFTGGNGPYDAQVISGALPKGITLDEDLILAGVPQEVGSFPFELQISDRSSPPARATFNLNLEVVPLAEPGWEVQHAHNRIMDLHFFDEKMGIAVGWSGQILDTRDGGKTWSYRDFGHQAIFFHWVGDEGWMIADNRLFHSTNRGEDWGELPQPLSAAEGVFFIDSQMGWIFGTGISYTENGGTTWTPANHPVGVYVLSMDFPDAMNGFAGGQDATVLKSVDGGKNWTDVLVPGFNTGSKAASSGPPRPPRYPGKGSLKGPGTLPEAGAVEFIDAQRGWIGTNAFEQPNTLIFRTENGGETWTKQNARGSGNIEKVQFLDDGLRGWAVPLFDTAFWRTTNGGSTWTVLDFNGNISDTFFTAMQFLDQNTGFVAYHTTGDVIENVIQGLESSIYKTQDGGQSFHRVFGFHDRFNSVPNGNAFENLSHGPDFTSIRFFDDLRGFAVGRQTDDTQFLRLYSTENGGATWRFINAPQANREVLMTTPLHGWALRSGLEFPVLETRDGGKSFIPRSDITPDGTAGAKTSPDTEKQGFNQANWNDIFFVDDQHGWIYISRGSSFSYSSRILRTEDSGATWNLIHLGNMRDDKKLLFTDRENGWLVSVAGTIESTTDGGQTWNFVYEPTSEESKPLLDIAFRNLDEGWAAGEEGALLRHTGAPSDWDPLPFPTSWKLLGLNFPGCQRGVLVGAKDPIFGPPILLDQTESIFDASVEVETGLLYHDLRSADFSSTESGWAYGGFGAGMKYAAPTDAFAISTDSLPEGRLGAAFNVQLESENGQPTVTWSICASRLPGGLDFSNGGLFSGTPTEGGVFRIRVSAVDGSGQEAGRVFTLSIQPDLSPTILTDSLPDGSVGTPYNAMLTAMGGAAPYDWFIEEGDLPPGLSMILCGLIGGTPTTPGIFPFRARVFDSQSPQGWALADLSIEIAGRFADGEGDECEGRELFCLAREWKSTGASGPPDYDGDGSVDADDVLEVLRDKQAGK
jgi:photosystem II stability/assembly factor-like uncharacterized protein